MPQKPNKYAWQDDMDGAASEARAELVNALQAGPVSAQFVLDLCKRWKNKAGYKRLGSMLSDLSSSYPVGVEIKSTKQKVGV